jgi:hypothetical protein
MPPTTDFSKLSAGELLALYGDVIEELRDRAIVRSTNNPVADYSELLFCKAFGWLRESNSKKGYDALCEAGLRYQLKGRRPTRRNKSRQVSALRGLDDARFDMLAGVLYHPDFTIARAVIIPHAIVLDRSAYVKDWGWRFHLRDDLWKVPQARDVTAELQAVQI